MYYTTVSRNEFMSFFVQDKDIQGRLFDNATYSAPKFGHIGLLWRDKEDFYEDESVLPCYIVVNDNEVLDFFAWVSAHFQSLNPISTYHHVIKYSYLKELIQNNVEKAPESAWSALVGLALGETYAMGGGTESQFAPTAFAVSTSFSYLLGRCITEGFSPKIWNIAYENWLSLRDFFSLSQPVISRERFYFCAYFINTLLNGKNYFDSNFNDIFYRYNDNVFFNNHANLYFQTDKKFLYDLESVLSEGFDTQSALLRFSKIFDLPFNAYDFFSFPKEERYSSLKSILSKIEIKSFIDEFLYAYLVNLVSPGSFTHTELFTGKYKSALPWYGLCAGLSSKSKIKTSFNFLGKRVYRDMTRKEGVFAPPRCDISFDELISIYKTKEELFDSVKLQRVTIEIVPNIDIIMVKQSKQSSNLVEGQQLKMVENFIEYLADESHYLLQVLRGSQERTSPVRKRRPKK